MREAEAANRFLFQKLSEDDDLAELVGDRIFSDSAPDATTYPYVIYSKRSGVDFAFIRSDQSGRIKQEPLFQINAVTEDTDKQGAYDISNVIDNILEGASLDIVLDSVTYHIQGCWRESDVDYVSKDEGVQHNYVGGNYRLFLSRG